MQLINNQLFDYTDSPFVEDIWFKNDLDSYFGDSAGAGDGILSLIWEAKHNIDSFSLQNIQAKHNVDSFSLQNTNIKHNIDSFSLQNTNIKHNIDSFSLQNSAIVYEDEDIQEPLIRVIFKNIEDT